MRKHERREWRRQVKEQIREQLRRHLHDQGGNQVGEQVREQVRRHLQERVGGQIREQVRRKTRQWFEWAAKRLGFDLFARTRLRMTVFYSGFLLLFLALFFLIGFSSLAFFLFHEQNNMLQTAADQNVAKYQALLQVPMAEIGRAEGNAFFSYAVDRTGQVAGGEETMSHLRQDILSQLRGWTPSSGEVHFTQIFENGQHAYQLLVSGRTVFLDGQYAGVIYTGLDISSIWHLFGWVLQIMAGLAILFLLISTFVGQFMAKKALVPIRNVFTRQRQFAADASHELRTPLSVMKMSIEALEVEEGDNLSDFSRSVMADMKLEVDGMTRLVSDLLTLARADSDTIDLLRQPFDVVSVAEQLVRGTQALAGAKQIRLELESPPELIVRADQDRLKQLLYILLDNAIKYTPDGGSVTVSLAKQRVEARRQLVIRVRDTGVGIPQEHQARIFDRFYRGDKARSREMGGTGLGLSIAKWIVDAHRGTILVDSAPGQGSTFTVRIPM